MIGTIFHTPRVVACRSSTVTERATLLARVYDVERVARVAPNSSISHHQFVTGAQQFLPRLQAPARRRGYTIRGEAMYSVTGIAPPRPGAIATTTPAHANLGDRSMFRRV